MTVSETDELLTIERVAVLQRVGLLSAVPGNRLIAVARLVEEVRVGPDVTIIERGALEDWLFVVAEGRVRVHVDSRTLVEHGPGAVVGELAVLAPAPRSASVTLGRYLPTVKCKRIGDSSSVSWRPTLPSRS